jgi:ribosomal protein L22
VNEAVAQLAFSPSLRSVAVRKAIERAAAQASALHVLPRDALMVEAAWTGKHVTAPRQRHASKGRTGRSHYRTSRVSVRLREMGGAEAAVLNKARATSPAAKAALDRRAY